MSDWISYGTILVFPSLIPTLPVNIALCYIGDMSATQVIEEIKHLSPAEQVEVIKFAFQLASTRPLTGKELAALAQRMVDSDDPAEVARLKTSIASGFYGN